MTKTIRKRLCESSLTIMAVLLMMPASFVNAQGLELLSEGANSKKVSAKGHGVYQIAGSIDIDFKLNAKMKVNDSAKGNFRHTLVFQGLLIDFLGDVTCLTVDAANGRAWIGGIVTENNSDHPSFTTEIHQPGKDVWFRVLDTGTGSSEPDRSTFLGFEGAAGIITSEEYCELAIWPGPPDDEPNARTNPVIQGKIKVNAVSNEHGHEDD